MKKLLTLALSLALTATVGVASANTKLTVGCIRHPARRDSRSGQADSR